MGCNCLPAAGGFADLAACQTACAANTATVPAGPGVHEPLQCALWYAGNAGDTSEADLNALACGIAASDGWSQCQGWCANYCFLADATCGGQSPALFTSSQDCLDKCADYPRDEAALSADFPNKNGDLLECRLRYLIEAKQTPAQSCGAGGPTGISGDGTKACAAQ